MRLGGRQHTQETAKVADAPAADLATRKASRALPDAFRAHADAPSVEGLRSFASGAVAVRDYADSVVDLAVDLLACQVASSTLDLSDPDAAWEWVKANVADIDEDFESIAREHTEAYCQKFREVQQKGVVEIHRVVVMPSIDQLDTARIGTHWSFERDGAGDYGMMRQRLPEDKTWLLTGTATPDDIDWEYGLYSFVWYGEDQWECSLKGGVGVPVIAVNGETLPRPLECRAYNLNSCGGKGSMHPDDDEMTRAFGHN